MAQKLTLKQMIISPNGVMILVIIINILLISYYIFKKEMPNHRTDSSAPDVNIDDLRAAQQQNEFYQAQNNK